MYNCFVDGDEIKQVDQFGKQVLVGYSVSKFNKLLDVAEQYKKKLEDAGLIEKVLSPEEKQTQLLEKILSKVDGLESRISSLEGKDG